MSKPPDLQAIPAAACTLHSEFELGDNGEGSKTAPISMLARSSQPIEHWYWGKVSHDISGYNLNGKSRIPIDFDHDTAEAIGYINKFEQTDDGLVMSGTLVSHFDGDRADKIMRDQRAGIPYESSINFGGDGIEVEMIANGDSASVNGYELAGPATIIRKYPMRGVALTLYGADGNTNSKIFMDAGTVSASVLEQETEEGDMPNPKKLSAEDQKSVEAPDSAAEEVATTETEGTEPTELTQAVEAEATEAVEAVEVVEVDAEEETEEDTQFSATEFVRLVTDFGADVAAATVTNGGGYTDALQLAYEARGERVAQLESQVAELSANPRTASSAVAFADGEAAKNKRVPLASGLQAKFDNLRGK